MQLLFLYLYLFIIGDIDLNGWISAVVVILLLLALAFITFYRLRNVFPDYNEGRCDIPGNKVILIFFVFFTIVLLLDIGLKILFFDKTSTQRNMLTASLGLESYFNKSPFIIKHIFYLITGIWIFGIGPLYYRLRIQILDKIWIASSAMTFASGIILTFERLFFGGVHDIFYVGENFRYICPSCGAQFNAYVWCPADLFGNWGLIIVLLVFLISFVYKMIRKMKRYRIGKYN